MKEFHSPVESIKVQIMEIFSSIHLQDTPYILYALRVRRKHDMKKKLCMRVACTKQTGREKSYKICYLYVIIIYRYCYYYYYNVDVKNTVSHLAFCGPTFPISNEELAVRSSSFITPDSMPSADMH